ncbi:ABC transporter substrate-binding protein [Trueperella bialowiezensis]|uniref:Maltose-binding periplasmic proteins/domains n=1 Tax=Trueperella bialowiezensis TaxID=312285 RepID=A0A448PE27_9ACTO|nr:ABC transporter substrate-binding protein [Trueperella bialowiezensis]VEI13197.1 Maltose-binding periplasmic proteins/domains [Trueperella bialowiezensis]
MKRIAAIFAVLLASTSLAACSSNDSDNTGSDSQTTTTSTSDAGSTLSGDYPDLTGETLTVASDWSGAEQANFEKVLDAFSQATGAKVVYTSLGNNVATALGTQIEGGSPPNIALIPQPGLMNQLVDDGAIVPLSDDVLAEVKENYAETWVDLGSKDDKAYGVWFKAANKSTMWYNTALYDAAGVEPPQTWDEYVTALQTLADSGTYGVSIGADVGWPLTDWFENVYLRTAGPEKYDQLTNHEIPWTDPSVEEALTVLAEVWGNQAVVQPGGAQRTFPDSVTAVFGDNPEAATVYEGDFVAGNIADQTSSVVGKDAKFYPFPSINGSAPAVMGAGNVAVAFDDSEATQALMKYLASPDSANIWIPLGGFTSPNQKADMSLYPDETALQIAQELVNAETFRFDMSDLVPSEFGGTEGQGMWQEFINFYENPSDIKGAMDALEKAAQAAYAK